MSNDRRADDRLARLLAIEPDLTSMVDGMRQAELIANGIAPIHPSEMEQFSSVVEIIPDGMYAVYRVIRGRQLLATAYRSGVANHLRDAYNEQYDTSSRVVPLCRIEVEYLPDRRDLQEVMQLSGFYDINVDEYRDDVRAVGKRLR